MAEKTPNNERINCRRCVHFAVTWEPARPYSCRKYGFKSTYIPSLEVFRSTGQNCLAYEPKPQRP